MATAMATTVLIIRSEATDSSNGAPPPHSLHSLPRSSWIVRTESNVRKFRTKTPDSPCTVCLGRGRAQCSLCEGTGRRNCTHLAVLPRGEWPKWCKGCGGSGLDYCDHCLGTGEYRHPMGFRFTKKEMKTRSDED